MHLTDRQIKETKPGLKPLKLFDGDGLHLLIQPNGSGWWRQRYSFEGKEKTLSLGTYPEITLKRARPGAAPRATHFGGEWD